MVYVCVCVCACRGSKNNPSYIELGVGERVDIRAVHTNRSSIMQSVTRVVVRCVLVVGRRAVVAARSSSSGDGQQGGLTAGTEAPHGPACGCKHGLSVHGRAQNAVTRCNQPLRVKPTQRVRSAAAAATAAAAAAAATTAAPGEVAAAAAAAAAAAVVIIIVSFGFISFASFGN